MDWPTIVISLAASVTGGSFTAWVSKRLERRNDEKKALENRDVLKAQNAFSVGTVSHMATVAFNKHVEFCEAYIEEMYRALDALNSDGGIGAPLEARSFSQIRQRWALWLTPGMEIKLDRFESAITQIVGGPARDETASGAASNERTIERHITFLRAVLGTEKLTALRDEAMK